MRRSWMLLGVWLAIAAPAAAGKYNSVLKIGDAAPAWSNLEGVDGKRHSLADLAGKDVVVVVFTCNSCPVATDYEDRIIEFAKKHAQPTSKVALVAINVNKVADDRLPKMKERAESRGFDFPYLYDDTQKIGKEYGANFTPEVFVLNKQRQVVYMGGIDDNSNPLEVKVSFLEPAVTSALEGKVPRTAEAPAIGCRIRYERERRPSSEK